MRIANVLMALDADILDQAECRFGGGTAIALRYGEYRESRDIDFLVSSLGCYRDLRLGMRSERGLSSIVRDGATLQQTRELRADQYGIRTAVDAGTEQIKLEIIFESRIALQRPEPRDRVCGVSCLSPTDLATTKLLANSDRWADTAAHSRDLIDLAMMNPPRRLLNDAIEKAEGAYGASIREDLTKAIHHLRDNPNILERCMRAMRMDPTPRALLWKRIRRLAPRAHKR